MTVPLSRRGLLAASAVAASGAVLRPAAAHAHEAPAQTSGSIFVVGDSTASVYEAARAPRAGWAQALPVFTADGVAVVDRAWSGASSKSYADAGYLDAVVRDVAEGDFLLISFGHNDQKTDDPDRGTDPHTTYQDYLSMYVEGALAEGATPVLVTSVERRRFDGDGDAEESLGEYPAAMLALAEETGTAAIDLHALSLALWDGVGEEASKDYFLWVDAGHPNYPDGIEDDTHFQAHGAIEVARLVAGAAADQGVIPETAWDDLDREVADDEVVWPAELPDLS